jgi:hypothetical protein
MRLARDVALDARHFRAESFLGLLLGYSADTQGDPNSEIALVDESSAVREYGDSRCVCRGHELLLFERRSIFERPDQTASVYRC